LVEPDLREPFDLLELFERARVLEPERLLEPERVLLELEPERVLLELEPERVLLEPEPVLFERLEDALALEPLDPERFRALELEAREFPVFVWAILASFTGCLTWFPTSPVPAA